jgi:hypothetical protein
MKVVRRVYLAVPIILAVTIVLASRVIHHDPWHANSILGWMGADIYYPRSLSLLGDWVMVGLSLWADFWIVLGCGIITFSYWVHRNHSLQLNPEAIRLVGGSFGLLGATHLLNMATMFSGIYLVDLMVRSSAAAACCVTAAYTAKALLSRQRR